MHRRPGFPEIKACIKVTVFLSFYHSLWVERVNYFFFFFLSPSVTVYESRELIISSSFFTPVCAWNDWSSRWVIIIFFFGVGSHHPLSRNCWETIMHFGGLCRVLHGKVIWESIKKFFRQVESVQWRIRLTFSYSTTLEYLVSVCPFLFYIVL